MPNEIYDPLTQFITTFNPQFKNIVNATFDQLTMEAQVDTEKNQETCCELYKTEKSISSKKSHMSWWVVLREFMILLSIAGFIIVLYFIYREENINKLNFGAVIIVIVGDLSLLFWLILPKIKKLNNQIQHLEEKAINLKDQAWNQMELINSLYDWDIFERITSKVIPNLEFDSFFTTKRLEELKRLYGWNDSFNKERSVIYSQSGHINGNPFVICKTRRMLMGSKVYYGSKTIYWTTKERGSDGKYRTIRHSEVLRASISAQYPEYYEDTHLIYGNEIAPNLIFTRYKSGLAGRNRSKAFKKNLRRLRKMARNLNDSNFAMMTNEEFEVAFDTSNRNDNQQFALLFTPLAQENMMKLLKDNKVGYGDNFDFVKKKMINIIISDHMQKLNFNMNPDQYKRFDYQKAK